MKDLFTIGEVAELFGLNIRTLRYYHDIGLLEPELIDPVTNYRYYSTKQFEQLNTIKYLRAMDISIRQIAEFLRHREVDTMLSILKEQQREVQRKKDELELIEKKITSRLLQIDDAIHSTYEEVVIRTFPARHLAVLKKEISVTDDLEYPLRDLERTHNLNAAIFLGKVGLSVSLDHLLARSYGSFASIFVVLEEGDNYNGARKILPPGPYATIRFQGTHQEAPRHYDRIMDKLERSGAVLSGDSLEITMIDSGMTGDPAKFVTELQVPFTPVR